MRYVPAPVLFRPTGAAAPVGTIAQNERVVSPEVMRYQRILLGLGFTVGPQGADGRFAANTANGVQAFARWYNALPEGAPASAADLANGANLTRGPVVTVDRQLTPEKQVALQRFAARASDQLSDLQVQRTTVVAPPSPIPWGTVALVSAASAAVLGAIVYAINDSSKKKAPRA